MFLITYLCFLLHIYVCYYISMFVITYLCMLLHIYVCYYISMYLITYLCLLLHIYVSYYISMFVITYLCILLHIYVSYYISMYLITYPCILLHLYVSSPFVFVYFILSSCLNLFFFSFIFHILILNLIPSKVQEPMMEAQHTQAIQQSQSQPSNNIGGNILPWGTPPSSSSTPNNNALPNPWGSIPTPQTQPFGTYTLFLSLTDS